MASLTLTQIFPYTLEAWAVQNVAGLLPPIRERRSKILRQGVSGWAALGGSVGGFVFAGVAAGLAIHQPVFADTNIFRGLTQAAVFIAVAAALRHLALRATEFRLAGTCGHIANLALRTRLENIPLVTVVDICRCHTQAYNPEQ